MLIGWPGGSWEATAGIVGIILGGYAVVLWLGTIVWTYRDIGERTRDGLSQAVAVLLVVVFNLPGFFLYLVLRPHETLSEAYERRIEQQAIMREFTEQRHDCPTCQRAVKEDFLLCPYCRTRLQATCSGCARPLQLNWAACPYCGAQGPAPATSAVPAVLAQSPPAARPAAPPAAAEPAQASAAPAKSQSASSGARQSRRRSEPQPAQAAAKPASTPPQAGSTP
jgi:hypothetical protein